MTPTKESSPPQLAPRLAPRSVDALIVGALPEVVVAAAVAFGLVVWRAELAIVPNLNDSAIHSEMVRYATLQLRAGHLPQEGWFPYLGLGSPQFLHYQSLGATLTGALGLAIGANRAFSLSLYLLVSLWPISVYLSARLFRFDRWTAACAAAVAPFVISAIHVGFESTAYLWIGYGLWSQLWAMWTLPLAWGLAWRAMEDRRFVAPAAVLVAATIAFHFETGYLAVLPLVLFPFVVPTELAARLRRAVALAVAAAALSAWVVYPLLRYSGFAAINEFLQHFLDADSYGARRVLSWLVTGHLFDDGRLPVLTVLAGIGLVVCIARFRDDRRARALVVLFVATVLLFFGRPTWGVLIDALPGSHDLFLRRFITGVQLSGVLLCGVGAVAVGTAIRRGAARIATTLGSGRAGALVGAVSLCGLFVGYLAPAWTQSASIGHIDAMYISGQQTADSTAGAQLDALISRIEAEGGGRVYAGLPTNWGSQFLVGSVPVFKYLAYRDVEEVGYTLRTASLMTDPEAEFNEHVAGNYALFGVRYLILPGDKRPLVRASLVEHRGAYALWELAGNHYLQVVETQGSVSTTRADLGAAAVPLLDSSLPGRGIYPTLAFNGQPAAAPTLRPGAPAGAPGSLLEEQIDLVDGEASAAVVMRHRGVVLLKVSYDPGWQVRIDGRRATTEIIAPALVGVVVGPGRHEVTFTYHSYGGYPLLFALGALGLVVLAAVAVIDRRRRRLAATGTSQDQPDAPPTSDPLVPSVR